MGGAKVLRGMISVTPCTRYGNRYGTLTGISFNMPEVNDQPPVSLSGDSKMVDTVLVNGSCCERGHAPL